jgi:hypothetical protein
MESSEHIKRKSKPRGLPIGNSIVGACVAEKTERLSEYQIRRNINCKFYIECLDTAAKANAKELECTRCLFRSDKSYKMNNADYSGLLELYLTILSERGKI